MSRSQAGASRSRKRSEEIRHGVVWPACVFGTPESISPGYAGEQKRTVGVGQARRTGGLAGWCLIARAGTHESLPRPPGIVQIELTVLESLDQPEAVGLMIVFNLVESGIRQNGRYGPSARSPTCSRATLPRRARSGPGFRGKARKPASPPDPGPNDAPTRRRSTRSP